MKATPGPIVSGSHFFPNAPLLWTKWIPAARVTSSKWTADGVAPARKGGRPAPINADEAIAIPRAATHTAEAHLAPGKKAINRSPLQHGRMRRDERAQLSISWAAMQERARDRTHARESVGAPCCRRDARAGRGLSTFAPIRRP